MREEMQYAINKVVDSYERHCDRKDDESKMLMRATSEAIKEIYPKDYMDIMKIAYIQIEGIKKEKLRKEFSWNF